MKVVIIEDEIMTAEDLAALLKSLDPWIRIETLLHSVAEAKSWLRENPVPDLIFSDIQLGDGHSFEIFSVAPVQAPVIFCTAYDVYAMDAFRNNGIDYILKPFSRQTVSAALDKFRMLCNIPRNNQINYEEVMRQFGQESGDKKTTSLLVNRKDKIIPVKISDIALFTIEYKNTSLHTFNNQKFFVNHTLDELEVLCGDSFFRANRQFLINKTSVTDASQSFSRKLVVGLNIDAKHEVIIGKNKTTEFLEWLQR